MNTTDNANKVTVRRNGAVEVDGITLGRVEKAGNGWAGYTATGEALNAWSTRKSAVDQLIRKEYARMYALQAAAAKEEAAQRAEREAAAEEWAGELDAQLDAQLEADAAGEEAPVQLELDLDATIYGDEGDHPGTATEESAKADVEVLRWNADRRELLAHNFKGDVKEFQLVQAAEFRAQADRREEAWAEEGADGVLRVRAAEWAAHTARRATRRELAALLEVLRVDAPDLLAE